MSIKQFMKENYKHFNAAVCVDAAEAWIELLNKKGKMMITLAGAMSTAEIGISLSKIIHADKVHAICCTAANLEEDVFNLIAHQNYERIPHYRSLTKDEENALHERGMNRVTDTCIPENHAIRKIEKEIVQIWQETKKSYFPYEYIYQLLDIPSIQNGFQINPDQSWVFAAKEKNLPIFTPGWEDSSLGNILVANKIKGNLASYDIIKNGLEQMEALVKWYKTNCKPTPPGFFQIGGGIAGDFPICAVPLLRQDLGEKEIPFWNYFCQISDSTTSYGSYSGAVPNEKITWGKLSPSTPSFIIESDASIVAPLIFHYLLG